MPSDLNSAITIIIGAQWGDEGKGKITDYFAVDADYVVRFQGGNNAGHTLVVKGETYKLHLLPSGVLYPHITSVIGTGVVVDPAVLLKEIEGLTARGITPRLKLSKRAHVILPYHIALDIGLEQFHGVSGHARNEQRMIGRHHVQGAFTGETLRVFAGRLKVLAVLDEIDPQGAHGGVFLPAVAVRHDYGGRESESACRKADGLAVISTGGADDPCRPGRRSRQMVEIDQAAANLESAKRRVVFVLDPDFGPERFA